MVNINDLPQEILEHILYFVSPYEDLKSCRLVCQRWHSTCLGVVKKRKSQFVQSLKLGLIEWFSPDIGNNHSTITRRYSHSASIYESSMYVFGGCTATNTTFNDLWKFDLDLYKWTRLLTTGTYPSPKAYASMVTWKSNLILFGGWTHPSVYPLHQQWVLFSELHIYDILSNRWTQLYLDGCPPPTAGHTSTVHGDIVVVFGGLQKNEGLSSSTNDVYCLNLNKEYWFKPKVSALMPQPRYGHSQVKLDERHILIMAGCGGSNKLYSDVWLLTLPQNLNETNEEWSWMPIDILGIDNMPSQMWYNPACKVGDLIIVLSVWHSPNSTSGQQTSRMHQLLIPGTIRRQSANNVWLPPPNQYFQEPHYLDRPGNSNNIDVNINGQRGSLRPAASSDASASSENEDNDENSASNSRARSKPSIRPNASCDRERRLEMLSRMEVKIKKFRMNCSSSNGSPSLKKPVPVLEVTHCLVPHILDIKNILSDHTVLWQPISLTQEGIPPFHGTPPQPCLLYTLLLGRSQLLMFGGIPSDPADHEAVSNVITFLSTPFAVSCNR